MSIRTDYFDYLTHFQSTVTLAEYASSSGPQIALRHDIDHCIDTALEMAFWESENNIRASYFILDTAPYRNDPRLIDKCLQIQEFGHEVGIHTNSITKWFETGIDPYEDVKKQIRRFRDAGVSIYGTSAHGDRACYEHNFINYWIFRGLKTDNVIERESSLNAEGIFEPDAQKQIQYPGDHQLRRANGLTLNLWSGDEQDLGLSYEASHLESDAYFTDSGGLWKRSTDPIKKNLSDKRVQILMHPIHWRAPRKIYFFLSTARSGSKWLSTILNEASSCSGRHEYTLNHFNETNSNKVLDEKMTGHRLHELLNNEIKIEEGLEHTRQLVDSQERDYAEANVYLPLVLRQLTNKLPDAQLINLHRNPANVVRSIMNRGWYDTPNDTSHPANLYRNWAQFSPFIKCCHYVRFVNEKLILFCNERIAFEEMVTDSQYLYERLKSFGIAYYPLLAKELIGQKINSNRLDSFPSFEKWSFQDMSDYQEQLAEVSGNLGYFENKIKRFSHNPYLFKFIKKLCGYSITKVSKRNIIYNENSSTKIISKCSFKNIKIIDKGSSNTITIINSDKHAHLLLKGKDWSKLNDKAGWKLNHNGYYTVSLTSTIPTGVKINVFCLYYDKRRKLVHKRALGTLNEKEIENIYTFAAMGNSHFFNLALYLPVQEQGRRASLSSIHLKFQNY
jgi:hypothetical protein